MYGYVNSIGLRHVVTLPTDAIDDTPVDRRQPATGRQMSSVPPQLWQCNEVSLAYFKLNLVVIFSPLNKVLR